MTSFYETLPPSSNWTRFDFYYKAARMFFDGNAYNPNELATMLHDLLWNEIPAAFAVALDRAARAGPLRPNVGASFGRVVKLSVFLALGDIDQSVLPHYWRRNWEFFFTSCIEQLLRSNARVTPEGEPELARAFEALLEMLEPVRQYTTVPASSSSSAHALLHLSSIGRPTFLENGVYSENFNLFDNSLTAYRQPLTHAHCVLANVVASAILSDSHRDVATWTNAFGFFAGCTRWRAFFERVSALPSFDSRRFSNVDLVNKLTKQRLLEFKMGKRSPTNDDDTSNRPSTPPAQGIKAHKRTYETPERTVATAKRRKKEAE